MCHTEMFTRQLYDLSVGLSLLCMKTTGQQFNHFMTFVFLTANKYIESLCEDVIQAMRKCCEGHAGENSVCCSGFAKEHKSTDTKTTISQKAEQHACIFEIRGDFHGHMAYIFFKDYIIVSSFTCLFILTIKLSLNHQAVSGSHYLFNLVIQFSENIVMNSTSGILTGLNIGGILYHDVLSISCNLGKQIKCIS